MVQTRISRTMAIMELPRLSGTLTKCVTVNSLNVNGVMFADPRRHRNENDSAECETCEVARGDISDVVIAIPLGQQE